MLLMSVREATSRYGGTSLRTVLQALAAPGEWSRIWLLMSAADGKSNVPTHFLCVTAGDFIGPVNGFLAWEGKSRDARLVYSDGAIDDSPAVQWDQLVVSGAPTALFPTCDYCEGVLSLDDYFFSPGPAWGYLCHHCGKGDASGMLTAG